MPTSRNVIRVSSEISAPSRAYGAIPAERTRTCSSRPRFLSSRTIKCSAITLRAVFAAHTSRIERKRGPPSRAAPLPVFILRITHRSPRRHHLGHRLFLRDALGQFLLDAFAQLGRVPELERARLRDLPDAVPSLHQPQGA